MTDTDTYVTNPAAGNTAILSQITLGIGGTRDYQFGAAGHLEQVTAGANQVHFASDDEGRLADLSRPVASEAVDVLYDGRSFMQCGGRIPRWEWGSSITSTAGMSLERGGT